MKGSMSPWRKAFWTTYWVALRRSRKDKRARLIAFRISVLFLLITANVLLWLLPLRSDGGIWLFAFNGSVLGLAIIMRLLLLRSNRRRAEMLSFSLTAPGGRTPQRTSDVSENVRAYFEERALMIGSLVSRAASEIFIRHKELAPGLTVITRQQQNALLRQAGLWDKLEPSEFALAAAADGQWTEEQTDIVAWCEQLRVLRWVLRIDAELIPLAHFPKVEFALARGLLGEKTPFQKNKPILTSADVLVERETALAYTARIIAELRARLPGAGDPDPKEWAVELRKQSLGASTDYLAGTQTIGDLDDDSLRLLGMTASARERYAAYVADQLSAEKPSSFAVWSANALMN
jgi:hypothetical protein